VKSDSAALDWAALYQIFPAPIAALDCGKKCGRYNARGVPFCCDTRHLVPAAYPEEWAYLLGETDLWHRWKGRSAEEREALTAQVEEGQVLLECLGHQHCQRDYRSLACRAFPFYPYLTEDGRFLGLAALRGYSDRCWVISNLEVVTDRYRTQFVNAFEYLFRHRAETREHFRVFAASEREHYQQRGRQIPLLHRNGSDNYLDPESGRLTRVSREDFPRFEPYVTMRELPFPDEVE